MKIDSNTIIEIDRRDILVFYTPPPLERFWRSYYPLDKEPFRIHE